MIQRSSQTAVISLLIALLILAACAGPQAQPAATTVVVNPTVTLVPIVTVTAATGTAILVTPTAVPVTTTPTPMPTATATPTPTATATPTPTPCPPGEVRTGTFPSALTGESQYRIYLPPCYGQDGRVYPTLYLFGGNAQDDSAWDAYGMDETAEKAIRSGAIPPLLIVMADGGWIANSTSGGPRSYEEHIMDNLIPFIERTYCAWASPAGRAVGGLSRGGYWSLEIAFRHPGQFVSVGGHSAALIDSHAKPEVNPQYTALSQELGDLRIYLDMGVDDYLLPNTLQLHEDMAAQGIPHTWVLNEGAHEDSYWPQHLAEYLHWYSEPWSLDRDSYPIGDCIPAG